MEILEQKDNFLLKRNEVKLQIEKESTPSKQEAENIIVKQFNAGIENIVIKNIKGKYGSNSFVIHAFIYKTKEDKEKFEPKKKGEKKEEKTEIQEVKEEIKEEEKEAPEKEIKQEEKKEEKTKEEAPKEEVKQREKEEGKKEEKVGEEKKG